MVELYPAAREMIQAEWILFDFDDTLAEHHPESQYWAALHTVAMLYDTEQQFTPNQFVRHYELALDQKQDDPDLSAYLVAVRSLSAQHTGDAGSFEHMAAAFRDHPHDGNKLKEAIHTIPAFETTGAGPFWIARAKLLLAEGVPPSYGMTLMEGVPELIVQLQKLSKKYASFPIRDPILSYLRLTPYFRTVAIHSTTCLPLAAPKCPSNPTPQPLISCEPGMASLPTTACMLVIHARISTLLMQAEYPGSSSARPFPIQERRHS